MSSTPTHTVSLSPTEEEGTAAGPQHSDAPVSGSRAWTSGLWMIPLGWELAVPIVAGAVLGHRLDSRYQSTPVWTVLLLLLGAAAGFYNVLKLIQRASARDRHSAGSKRGGAC